MILVETKVSNPQNVLLLDNNAQTTYSLNPSKIDTHSGDNERRMNPLIVQSSSGHAKLEPCRMRATHEAKKQIGERSSIVVGDTKFLMNQQANVLISNRYDSEF